MIFSFNEDSLNRHKVTYQEVLEALADPFRIEVEIGEHKGNPTSIWIDKTLTQRLLEVGIEYLEDCNHIYHANKARAKYVVKYTNTR